MAGAELLSAAVAELYAADLDAFTARRGELAAQARAAGAAAVAKKIAGLRKPTRPAWVLNQLARADPSVPARLAELGDELRRAEAALDGDRIRELSQARRTLVDAATRQALALAGPRPTAALRDEVAATLAAAVADPDVAEQLAEGSLPRAVHHAGFGSGMPPALSLVRSAGSSLPATPGPAAPERSRAGRVRTGPEAERAKIERPKTDRARTDRARTEREQQRAAAARAKAARVRAEREYRQAVAAAQRTAAEADRAAAAAAKAEQDLQDAVQRLEQELADARQQLAGARQRARQAAGAQRVAHRALDRLHDQAAD